LIITNANEFKRGDTKFVQTLGHSGVNPKGSLSMHASMKYRPVWRPATKIFSRTP
jgi:hypothetical protein